MKKIFTLFTLALLSVGSAWADDEITVTWLPSNMTEVTAAGTASVTGILSVKDLTWSSDVTGPVLASASSKSWANFVPQTAVTKNNYSKDDYITFAVEVADGYIFTPTNVSLQIGGTGTGDNGGNVFSAIQTKNASAAIKKSSEGGTALTLNSFAKATYNGGETVYFYVYIGTRGNTTPIKGVSLCDVVLTGTYVSATAPAISASNASINATESGVETTQNIAVTGAYLTGSTLTATLSPAVEGLSVTLDNNAISEGTISTNAVLHYTTTENVLASTTTLTLSDGTTSKDVTITYSAKVADWALESISGAATWDFTKNVTSSLSAEFKYEDDDIATEHVYANIAELSFTSPFDPYALAFTGEMPFRSNSSKFAQNGTLRFNTSIAGLVTVVFTNTGGSNNNRYLKVNDQNGTIEAVGTSDNTESFVVAAGDVIITGVSGDDFITPAALRYKKVTFEPFTDGDAISVSAAGYATVVLANNAYFAATPAVKAYAAKANGSYIALSEVTAAPAGTALLIEAAEGNYTLQTASVAPAAVADNDLQAGPVTGDGASHYVLGKEDTKVGFGLLATGVDLPATKAYIAADKFGGAETRSFYGFEPETTGINALIKTDDVKGAYNLQGQRVAQPTKGLYIVNGKKVVVK